MRSESEVRWVRAKNTVGQATRASDWHAIIPGYGSLSSPPGTICGVGLVGQLQFEQNGGIRTREGVKHQECILAVHRWIAGIDPSPGPRIPDEPDVELAPPGSTRESA